MACIADIMMVNAGRVSLVHSPAIEAANGTRSLEIHQLIAADKASGFVIHMGIILILGIGT
jgi:hypothetical protein